jgi:hypothetical protein
MATFEEDLARKIFRERNPGDDWDNPEKAREADGSIDEMEAEFIRDHYRAIAHDRIRRGQV